MKTKKRTEKGPWELLYFVRVNLMTVRSNLLLGGKEGGGTEENNQRCDGEVEGRDGGKKEKDGRVKQEEEKDRGSKRCIKRREYERTELHKEENTGILEQNI